MYILNANAMLPCCRARLDLKHMNVQLVSLALLEIDDILSFV